MLNFTVLVALGLQYFARNNPDVPFNVKSGIHDIELVDEFLNLHYNKSFSSDLVVKFNYETYRILTNMKKEDIKLISLAMGLTKDDCEWSRLNEHFCEVRSRDGVAFGGFYCKAGKPNSNSLGLMQQIYSGNYVNKWWDPYGNGDFVPISSCEDIFDPFRNLKNKFWENFEIVSSTRYFGLGVFFVENIWNCLCETFEDFVFLWSNISTRLYRQATNASDLGDLILISVHSIFNLIQLNPRYRGDGMMTSFTSLLATTVVGRHLFLAIYSEFDLRVAPVLFSLLFIAGIFLCFMFFVWYSAIARKNTYIQSAHLSYVAAENFGYRMLFYTCYLTLKVIIMYTVMLFSSCIINMFPMVLKQVLPIGIGFFNYELLIVSAIIVSCLVFIFKIITSDRDVRFHEAIAMLGMSISVSVSFAVILQLMGWSLIVETLRVTFMWMAYSLVSMVIKKLLSYIITPPIITEFFSFGDSERENRTIWRSFVFLQYEYFIKTTFLMLFTFHYVPIVVLCTLNAGAVYIIFLLLALGSYCLSSMLYSYPLSVNCVETITRKKIPRGKYQVRVATGGTSPHTLWLYAMEARKAFVNTMSQINIAAFRQEADRNKYLGELEVKLMQLQRDLETQVANAFWREGDKRRTLTVEQSNNALKMLQSLIEKIASTKLNIQTEAMDHKMAAHKDAADSKISERDEKIRSLLVKQANHREACGAEMTEAQRIEDDAIRRDINAHRYTEEQPRYDVLLNDILARVNRVFNTNIKVDKNIDLESYLKAFQRLAKTPVTRVSTGMLGLTEVDMENMGKYEVPTIPGLSVSDIAGYTGVPMTYCVSDYPIDASDPVEACRYWSKVAPIPEALKFRGGCTPYDEEAVVGSWQWKRLDEEIVTISNKISVDTSEIITVPRSLIGAWVFTPIVDMIKETLSMLEIEVNHFSKAVVDLLKMEDFFPKAKRSQVENYVYNQGARPGNLSHQRFGLCLSRMLAYNHSVNKFSALIPHTCKNEYEKIYNEIISERKKFCSGFDLYAVTLDDLLARCGNDMVEPLPPSLVMVAYADQPRVVDQMAFAFLGNSFVEMLYAENVEICLGVGCKRAAYAFGHETKKICSEGIGCGAYGKAIMKSGYLSQCGYLPCAVVLKYQLTTVDESKLKSIIPTIEMIQPVDVPFYSVVVILSKIGSILGNGLIFRRPSGGLAVVTARHVVSARVDGQDTLPPGRWGYDKSTETDWDVEKQMKEMHGGEIIEDGGYYYPEKVRVEGLLGEQYPCKVGEQFGEVAVLEILANNDLVGHYVDIGYRSGLLPSCMVSIVGENGRRKLKVTQVVSTKNKELNYGTVGGYSGSPLLRGNTIVGVHLGGNANGEALAYSSLYMDGHKFQSRINTLDFCVTCGKLHRGDCNAVQNQMLSTEEDRDILSVVNQGASCSYGPRTTPICNHLSGQEDDEKMPPKKDKKDKSVTISKTKSGRIAIFVDEGQGNVLRKEMYPETFAEELKGLMEKYGGYHIRLMNDEAVAVDDLLLMEDEESEDVVDIVKRITDNMLLTDSQVRGHISAIDNKDYSEFCNLIGEDTLVGLMMKDNSELIQEKAMLCDSVKALSAKISSLQDCKKTVESSQEFEDLMQNYRNGCIKYLEDKATYDEQMLLYIETKSKLKEIKKKVAKEQAIVIQEIKEAKKSLIQKFGMNIKMLSEKAKDIIAEIAILERRKKEAKKGTVDEADKETLAQILELEDKIRDYKKTVSVLRSGLTDHDADRQQFIMAVNERVKKLQGELGSIKQLKAQETEQHRIELEEQSKAAAMVREDAQRYISKEAPKVPVLKSRKPKKVVIKLHQSILEMLGESKKRLSKTNKLINVISKLIAIENAVQHKESIQREFERNDGLFAGNGHDDSDIEVIDNHSSNCPYTFSSQFDRYVENKCKEGKKIRQMLQLLDQDSSENREFIYFLVMSVLQTQFYDMTDDLRERFTDCICAGHDRGHDGECGEMCDGCLDLFWELKGLLVQLYDRIHDDLLANFQLTPGTAFQWWSELLEEDVSNQAGFLFKPSYINLTPTVASSNLFQEHCLSQHQPAKVCCSNCDHSFECDQHHCEIETGSVGDIGCTLKCMRDQVARWRSHIQDCKTKRMVSSTVQFNAAAASLTCAHGGSSRQVNICSAHVGTRQSCFRVQMGVDMVPVQVNNIKLFADKSCLIRLVYRICKNHDKEECNRDLLRSEDDLVEKCVAVSGFGKRNECFVFGKTQFDLSCFDVDTAEKMRVFLASMDSTIVVIEDRKKFTNITNQALMEENESLKKALDLLKQRDAEIVGLREQYNELKSNIVLAQEQVLAAIRNQGKPMALKAPAPIRLDKDCIDFITEQVKDGISLHFVEQNKKVADQLQQLIENIQTQFAAGNLDLSAQESDAESESSDVVEISRDDGKTIEVSVGEFVPMGAIKNQNTDPDLKDEALKFLNIFRVSRGCLDPRAALAAINTIMPENQTNLQSYIKKIVTDSIADAKKTNSMIPKKKIGAQPKKKTFLWKGAGKPRKK